MQGLKRNFWQAALAGILLFGAYLFLPPNLIPQVLAWLETRFGVN